MLCFRKLLVAKKFMDRKGGVSQFSVEIILSHSAEKIRRGTLQSFIRFGNRINFCLRGWSHYNPSKSFCLAVAN